MFQTDLLAGKRVLITGGGSGLGKSMGRRMLELGAHLVICGRREDKLTAAQAEFDADVPGRTEIHVCDIRDADQVEQMLEAIWQTAPLDVLVNNAAGNFLAKSEELSAKGFDAVTRIVLNGTAYVTLGCGRRWLAGGHTGTVLSIVATYAWTGSAYVVPSACAKAGVQALTHSLAVEWGGRGIRLNAVAPGPFPTEGAWERLVPTQALEDAWRKRIPAGRFGEHAELADLACFLVSDMAGFINGATIAIDGGEWLKGAGQFNLMEQLSEAEWDAMSGRRDKTG
jgi:NAD(P)-dependent dehydrogenase (short-subunit alcohol dehydrogenase family)